MEKTLNLGAFEELDDREMMEVDGGIGPGLVLALALVGSVIIGAIADGTCKHYTGKTMADWVDVGLDYVDNFFDGLFN